MSSASRSGGGGGGAERTVHQDFIARIRYANTLPPPSNPPKLLEIPNTGLGSGYYTSSAFATRLAREQPLNIEIDAELGMPLDLIGMPGVFDGDDRSIQADPHPPPPHPHDRALLKPLSSLGKPRPAEAAVSFLRRTEYISSTGAKGSSSPGVNPFLTAPNKAARRPEKRAAPEPEPDAGTPAYVKRKIEQSFAAAQTASRDRYSRVRHPSKKNLRLAAAYPLLPDLGAFPDSGAYVTIKFSHNPVNAGTGVYDTRVLSGVFRPIEQTEEQRAAFEAATKAYERDPRRNPRPHNQSHYEYYLPEKKATGEGFRRTFAKSEEDGEEDDDEKFNFTRVRAYESIEEKELTHTTKYANEVLLAFTENAAEAAPDLGGPVAGGPRAALYYPVMLRSVLRSQRQKPVSAAAAARDMDDEHGDGSGADRPVDRLLLSVQAPPEDMREHIARFRSDPLQLQAVEHEEEEDGEGEVEVEAQHGNGQHRSHRAGSDDDDSDGGGGAAERRRRDDNSSSPAPRRSSGSRRQRDSDDEDDAEGEEEE